jgi:hypothetical protein
MDVTRKKYSYVENSLVVTGKDMKIEVQVGMKSSLKIY